MSVGFPIDLVHGPHPAVIDMARAKRLEHLAQGGFAQLPQHAATSISAFDKARRDASPSAAPGQDSATAAVAVHRPFSAACSVSLSLASVSSFAVTKKIR